MDYVGCRFEVSEQKLRLLNRLDSRGQATRILYFTNSFLNRKVRIVEMAIHGLIRQKELVLGGQEAIGVCYDRQDFYPYGHESAPLH